MKVVLDGEDGPHERPQQERAAEEDQDGQDPEGVPSLELADPELEEGDGHGR